MLRFRKVPVAKKLTDKRRGGGEYQHFPSKIFCLTVPKFSVAKPFRVSFSVSLFSGIEKVWIRGGGGWVVVSRFSVEKKFCLSVLKTFVE